MVKSCRAQTDTSTLHVLHTSTISFTFTLHLQTQLSVHKCSSTTLTCFQSYSPSFYKHTEFMYRYSHKNSGFGLFTDSAQLHAQVSVLTSPYFPPWLPMLTPPNCLQHSTWPLPFFTVLFAFVPEQQKKALK